MPGESAAHLARCLESLRRLEAYPHPVRSVEVRQTHISCVFLTGEFAYKVKKPVDFGFLDYTTLEARRHFCEEEVRLNRRLCPEVYLDVLPITESPDGLHVGGGGPAVEWCVRMRQMPSERMLPALLAAGQVTDADASCIAGVLARFHGGARSGPEITRYGSAEQIAEVAALSLPEHPVDQAVLPTEQREQIQAWQGAFLRESRCLFGQRRAEGWIRDCHGDLRTQNICLAPDLGEGVQVFDCIEFTDRFRFIDVASDLAYLLMDLDLAGRPDFGGALLRAYRAALPDPTLEEALPFYRCFRACVRGKIALLAAGEPEVPEPERAQHTRTAAAAFDLAGSYSRKRRRPLLAITVGLSGSGKSTIARELACRLPAVRLASDVVRKEPAGAAETTRPAGTSYGKEQVAAVYRELRRRAAEQLRRGVSVILDATFLSAMERRLAAETAADCGAVFVLLDCRCPEALARERITRRSAEGVDPSDAGLAVYDLQRRSMEPAQPGEGLVISVDCVRDPRESSRLLLRRLCRD